jgi:hypothetical protein
MAKLLRHNRLAQALRAHSARLAGIRVRHAGCFKAMATMKASLQTSINGAVFHLDSFYP